MTLNGIMAVILRYFSEFDSFRGALRKSSRSLSYLLMSSCITGRCPSCRPTNSVKALKASTGRLIDDTPKVTHHVTCDPDKIPLNNLKNEQCIHSSIMFQNGTITIKQSNDTDRYTILYLLQQAQVSPLTANNIESTTD